MKSTGLTSMTLLGALALLSSLIVAQDPAPPTVPPPPPQGQWSEVLALQTLIREIETDTLAIYMTDPRQFDRLREELNRVRGGVALQFGRCKPGSCPLGWCCKDGLCQPNCGPIGRTDSGPVPSIPPH